MTECDKPMALVVPKIDSIVFDNVQEFTILDELSGVQLVEKVFYSREEARAYMDEHREEILRLDLEEGVMTALLISASHDGDIATAKLLIDKGVNVNVRIKGSFGHEGFTPLHIAADYGHKDVAELLINNGAEVDALSACASTPLSSATICGHKDIVELLIAKGAAVNTKTTKGFIPLHFASSRGHKEIVELLIAKGADVNAKDEEGRTPLAEAIKGKHDAVADLLRLHGGR